MWDLPRPGLEAMSPALAGGFLATVPPGKPHNSLLNECIIERSQETALQISEHGKTLRSEQKNLPKYYVR